VSIRSISSLAPGLGYARPYPGGSGARRPVHQDPSVLSALSWGDREIIAAMFGADILTTGHDRDGVQVGVPAFVWLVADDRHNGRLPAGSEITSSYLQAIWDRHTIDVDRHSAPNPLTESTFAAARGHLAGRPQGATVDVRA
jgi:hypothetical protein